MGDGDGAAPVILALDLATISGAAWGQAGSNRPVAVSHRIAPAGVGAGAFLDAYCDWYNGLILACRPRHVVYEAPIIWGGKTGLETARKLMGLSNFTEWIAYRRHIDVREADGSTVTKFFTGRGAYPAPPTATTLTAKRAARRAAKKAAVMEQCRRLGWEAADDNAADALAIWAYSEFHLSSFRRQIVPIFGLVA